MSINYDNEIDVYAMPKQDILYNSTYTKIMFSITIIKQINKLMPADLQLQNDSRSLKVRLAQHLSNPTRIEVHIVFANDVQVVVWFDPITDEINYSQYRHRMDQLRDENEDLMTSKKFFEMINIAISISYNHLKIRKASDRLYLIDEGYPLILRLATIGVHPIGIGMGMELSLPPIIV